MRIDIVPPKGERYSTVMGFDSEQCPRCGGAIGGTLSEWRERYCRHCIQFGMIQESTRLYVSERAVAPAEHVLKIDYSLTKEQSQASDFLCQAIDRGKETLLHAVCGAGKTEILYALFLTHLRRGSRICLTIPRRDIVVELATRIAKAFPNTLVKALHQEAKDDEGAHLIVSTVHQLIRFREEFDLIVLDEADAFPYRGEPFLERLIQNARKPGAPILRMSATVDQALQEHIKRQKVAVYRLAIRYHGHPLDVPKVIPMAACPSTKVAGEWIEAMNHQKALGRRTIVFVPTIEQTTLLNDALKDLKIRSEAVSSRSKHRHHAIESFRLEKLDCLIATSILERGVTFSNIDVFVYGADHLQYDTDQLIQIAGRTGRSALFPSGNVTFFAVRKTKPIVEAVKAIEQANADAGFQKGRRG